MTHPSGPHQPPKKIAPDTYLIQDFHPALGAPLSVYFNSAVILGSEPVLIDTGTRKNREQWLQDVFGLVEPEDVRWVFLSHDDADHTGNLAEVMDLCPNATLVCSWVLVERYGTTYDFPLQRCRWVNDGESFVAGDRTLAAIRPPVYDSPATRGLLDTKTGVYWAADAFAAPVPGGPGVTPIDDVADADPNAWFDGMVMFGLHGLSPWLRLVDSERYLDSVKAVKSHGMTTVISGHSPVITGARLEQAFDMLARLAGATPPACPDQAVLDMMLEATGGG